MAEDELTPFSGTGGWLGGPQARSPQITWIQQHSISVPETHRNALIFCESASEMRFILPLCTLSDWSVKGDRVFTNGRFTVTLQEELGPYRADFVFRSDLMARPLIVEVDGPSHYAPSAAADDRRRTAYLENMGFDVRRLAADEAGVAGVALRREFAREQIISFEAAPGQSQSLLKRQRRWPPGAGALAYGVVDVPRDERRAVLSAWLTHRRRQVTDRALDLLTVCDDAAELEFVFPFLDLPGAHIDEDSVSIGPFVLFLGQGEGADRMDVVLALDSGDGFQAIVFDIEPMPFIGVDQMAVAARRTRWLDTGFSVEAVSPFKAAGIGRRMADAVARQTQSELELGG